MNDISNFLSAFEKKMTSLERYVSYDYCFVDLLNYSVDCSQEALYLIRRILIIASKIYHLCNSFAILFTTICMRIYYQLHGNVPKQ